MKNLKRVLAVVLVVCLAFSFMVVASAAAPSVRDYNDAASIQQVEAVDLLTAIGILQGTDGSFNPTGDFTREQAAKIIAFMLLGANAANGLKTSASSFADVAPTRWSAPYIQFCAARGIINGDGTGNFNPEGKLTGSQFAKLALTALGYGKNGEYVGPNWEVNAISDASRLGILEIKGQVVDYSAVATREQVAQYAFNAFTKDSCYTVAFSKDKETYDPYPATLANPTQTLAFQQGITKRTDNTNGVEGYVWLKNNVVLNGNKYSSSDDKILSTTNDGTAISKLTTPNNAKYVANLDATTVEYWVNGIKITPNTVATYPAAGNDVAGNSYWVETDGDLYRAASAGYSAGASFADDRDAEPSSLYNMSSRGLIITLVDTDTDGDIDKVMIIEKRVMKLGADAYVNPTTNLVTVPGVCSGQLKSKVIGYEGLKKDDVVLYYQDANYVTHIEKAAIVEGQMTSGSPYVIVVDGVYYSASGLATVINTFTDFTSQSTNYNVPIKLYLDNSGAVVYATAIASGAAATYGVVVGYDYNTIAETAVAKIAKGDGTVAVYSVAGDANGIVANQTEDFEGNGTLVQYILTSDNKIILYPAANPSEALTAKYSAKGTSFAVNSGTKYISSTTKVFYMDTSAAYGPTNLVSVTTGFNATVDADVGVDVTYIYAPGSTSVVAAVLISQSATVSESSNYCYVVYPGAGMTTRFVGAVPYYDYGVYVNGAYTVLTSSSNTLFNTAGLYKYDVGANNMIVGTPTTDHATITNAASGAAEVTLVDTGYFTYDDGGAADETVLINSNTKYYQIDTTFPGNVTEGSIAKSTAYVKYYIKHVVRNTDKIATQVFYTYELS